jgi:hypothetical protein
MRTETITRAGAAPTIGLAPGVELRTLVTGSLGSDGLTTGLANSGRAQSWPITCTRVAKS